MQDRLTAEQIQQLRAFDTCVISDAIESFGVRLRNEGFAMTGFQCLSKIFPSMVGHAATCKVRSADPPVEGGIYIERTDWWKHIAETPAPRVVVMQDIDERPGTGAFLGRVHVNILKSMGCVGAITNGAARELPGIEASGFQVFAARIAVSRAYIHIVEYGGPVEVGGLRIQPGDLIHGDRHGILTVPQDLASRLPATARTILEIKQRIIDLAKKPGVTHEELSRALAELHAFNSNDTRDQV